jgi:hypothetical protein
LRILTITKEVKRKKMKTDERIEEIFKELDISGDICPSEDVEDYWKRKLIEVYEWFGCW